MLKVNNIEVVYNHIVMVLRGISLQVPEGKIVAFLGSNGAGKSTTLKAISGTLRYLDGEIVKGSIEASRGDQPTCHRLRGILRKLYEVYMDKKIYCQEVECESTGKDRCVFKIISEPKW